MSRRVLLCAALALVFAAPAAAAPSWAQPQIKVVTARGLMGGEASAFRPADPLLAGELADLVTGLTGKQAAMSVDSTTPVTIAQLDAQLVRALGLLPAARQFSAGLRAAGLTPTRYFGTETVARLIGLRVNHPAAEDGLELGPDDPATRAEAAYSAAHILGFTGGEVELIAGFASTFQLPTLTGLQRNVLQTAVSLVGYPYVWGGTSERAQDPFATGTQVPGGFDCSGFAWRVFKLQPYAGGEALAGVFRGRTSMAMSGEVPAKLRVKAKDLQPADVLFFGAKGPKSKPAQVDHVAVYLGNGWLVESSRQGVALGRLDDWRLERLAWARRPLAEAALNTP
jgi:hypothetical protein